MQIEFTKEQYKALLKLTYCWDMMINWPRLHDDRIIDIEDLCSYIYSKAKDFGYEDYVDYSKENDRYYCGRKLDEDEDISDYIETYDNDNEVFWEDLIDMLVKRDIEEKFKNPLLNNISEFRDKLDDFYSEEFSKNWISNLRVKR